MPPVFGRGCAAGAPGQVGSMVTWPDKGLFFPPFFWFDNSPTGHLGWGKRITGGVEEEALLAYRSSPFRQSHDCSRGSQRSKPSVSLECLSRDMVLTPAHYPTGAANSTPGGSHKRVNPPDRRTRGTGSGLFIMHSDARELKRCALGKGRGGRGLGRGVSWKDLCVCLADKN